MNGYVNIPVYQFTAKAKDSGVYKEKKVGECVQSVVQYATQLQNSLDAFKTAFDDMNNYTNSDQWTTDAAEIAEITDEIRAWLGECMTNIVTDIENINNSVVRTDKKASAAIQDNKGKLSGLKSSLDGFGKPRYRQ